MPKPSLTDILHGNDGYFDNWDNVTPAGDFSPVPPGEYIAHLVDGEPFNAKTGTAGYKLVFGVIEGEHAGRKLWYDIWLTDNAKSQAKRDLDKLAITDPKTQLNGRLPQGIRCRLYVAVRKDDNGADYNRVKRFDVMGIDAPEADPFAPADAPAPDEPPQDAAGGAA